MYGYVSNKYVNHEEFNPNNSLYSYSCEVNSNNHLTKYQNNHVMSQQSFNKVFRNNQEFIVRNTLINRSISIDKTYL